MLTSELEKYTKQAVSKAPQTTDEEGEKDKSSEQTVETNTSR